MTKHTRNTKLYESTGRRRGRPRKDSFRNHHVQNNVFTSAKVKLYDNKSCAESEHSSNTYDSTHMLLSIMCDYKKMYFDRDSLLFSS